MNREASRIRRLSIAFTILAFLVLGYLAFGCSDKLGVEKENRPPNVWLSSAPPEGSMSSYTIQMFWGGWDPDGEIAYYEYAITDNDTGYFNPADTVGSDKWHRVYSNDSTFTFSADVLADSSVLGGPLRPVPFIRSHTFFIRAVDEKGKASENPAYRSFTARTLSPDVDILIPVYSGQTPALLPPITRFYWEARDYVDDTRTSQDPDSVRWILLSIKPFGNSYERTLDYIRKNPTADEWSDWNWYRAPLDTGQFWITPPLEFGSYMFAVQAKDEAGAVTPVFDERRNARRVIISKRTTGPYLRLRNSFVGTLKSSTETTVFTIIDMPAAVPLQFEFSASAASYGGIVAGYRYGWDITDLSQDDQWAIGWTPFNCDNCRAFSDTRTYYYGTHTFHVEAIDNSGYKSRINVKINIVPFTMERNLLIVDDYKEEEILCGLALTKGAMPCDDEHDAFWVRMMQNLEDFDPISDMQEVSTDHPLPIFKLAQYRSVIWNAYGGYSRVLHKLPFLYDVIKFIPKDPQITVIGKVQPNLVALFMAAGGHILICGEQPMTQAINNQFMPNERYPFIFQFELLGDQDGDYANQVDNPVGDQSFAFQDMCLDVLDIAYTGWNVLRRPGSDENGCGVTHQRLVRHIEDGLRECLPIDPKFPLLQLRPEVGEVGRFYAPDARGLNDEMYNPPYFIRCGSLRLEPRDCFEPIYGHGCIDGISAIYNAPNAAWTSVFANVIPDIPGGVGARSATWGFEPVFFDTTAVREAVEVILFDEWKLPQK
ncbi:MAG: hypothetical protein GTO51_01200 [Candidatus Latescibacteria bacterium]|nr:hypothetical protein [Candidatus Latescibacterota bacterium]NIM21616.1 hypothetical protein [Candidatus Latescibacterota bacterium]NIM64595.1 hypothetical protein [Candidatus Latescibacterota bacterium]NIO01110.1 hypothetical protein [Candidatus Latescibacterota bacterium]NIO27503.1 hypothetical protein [Candidatus Latescibacterota bacterium]